MAAEAPPLRPLQQTRQSRAALSRKQVESLLSRSVAAFGLLFAVQTIPSLLVQLEHGHEQRQWTQLVVLLFCLSLTAAFMAAMEQRFVASTATAFAVLYPLVIATWPLAVRSPLESDDGAHWLHYLLTVATAMAAIAFPPRVAALYTVVVPTMYAVASFVTNRSAITGPDAILGAIYSIILSGVVLVIVAMLRQAASTVDRAQAAALESYSHAVRHHATEVERVQVDAIVHDSVLTTLLSAARATTPEAMDLSARMAENAIGFLSHAAGVRPLDGGTVSVATLAERITTAATAVGAAFELRTAPLGPQLIPTTAAEAVYSGAVQAMLNSAQHAGRGEQVSRWLSIRSLAPDGIEVQVGDTGTGFDAVEVPTERLGVRVSIVERVTSAGGAAEVDTELGEGTVVSIRWPAVQAPS